MPMGEPDDRPKEAGAQRQARATLPPPEVGRTSDVGVELPAEGRLTRRTGARADEAYLRARLEQAVRSGDAETERVARVELARYLAHRDRGLDEAASLALRAIRTHDDSDLRRELSGWLESLGEAGLAAAVLRPIVEGPSAVDGATLIRVGVLHARAGDPGGANEAFEEAARLDPNAAIGLELRGALGGWAPEAISPAAAAEAYVEAAARHAAANDDPLEDLLRAFEADVTSDAATSALATRLASRGKILAADEIWREHGEALVAVDSRRARAVHARRRNQALAIGDFALALGAAFDEGLDAQLDGDGATLFDELLSRAGLIEMLAARLEAEAEHVVGGEERDRTRRVGLYEMLARLCIGPLAQPARAAVAYVEVLALRPSSDEARNALRDLLDGEESLVRTALDTQDLALLRRLARDKDRGAHGHDAELEIAVEQSLEARARGEIQRANEITRNALSKGKSSTVLGTHVQNAPPRLARLAWMNATMVGDFATQAKALEPIAADAPPHLRAVLLAVAAGRLLSANDKASARRVGAAACQAEPTLARAAMTLASASLDENDRTSAAAMELAIKLVCARGTLCARLAAALEAIGEGGYAVAWTQQYVALRAGDRDATKLLVDRVVRANDAARLGDALLWVLSQPQPSGPLAELVSSGLDALTRIDSDRALIVARRALDVFGPRNAALRESLLFCGRGRDDQFVATVLERWIAAGATADERRDLFIDLARCRAALRDPDGEARAIALALREEGDADELAARIDFLSRVEAWTGDGCLAFLEARGRFLEATPEKFREAASAWRELGAARWDLASDHAGAEAAWIKAATLAGPGGFSTMTLDLAQFSNAMLALDRMAELIAREDDKTRGSAIAAQVARAALALGQTSRALEFSRLALEHGPELAGVLEVAERASLLSGRGSVMSALYDTVGSRALGRFGKRAAHYRGARFFEQLGDSKLALKHAADAFIAVPSEGATYLLLSRISKAASDTAAAVRAVETVAELSHSRAHRSGWLLRAAALAGPGEDGARIRVDFLLRAALLEPSPATLAMLGDAARELVSAAPDELEPLAMRIGNASKMLTAKIEGPDGARVALALALLEVELFDDGEDAITAIDRALASDADIEEYEKLTRYAMTLASCASSLELIMSGLALIEKPYSNVGAPAVKLLAAIAAAREDAATRDRLTVYAAERAPEDFALVRAGDEALRRLNDDALTARFDKKSPPDERAQAFLAHARDLVASNQTEAAVASFDRAVQLLPAEERDSVLAEIRAIYENLGREEDFETRALREAASESLPPQERADRYTQVAHLKEKRGDIVGATHALLDAARADSAPLIRWSAVERAAELANLAGIRVTALREIDSRVADEVRPAVLRRLARALEEVGDVEAALAALEKVLSVEPDDEDADRAIEAILVGRNDYPRLVAYLAGKAARLGRTERRDALRAVRLRRAAILEQRLGRIEEACGELERLLRDWPENETALRYLADLYERSGQMAKAAPLLRHLSELARGPQTQADLELRAATAMRDAGNVDAALTLVREILTRDPELVEAHILWVDLARKIDDPIELGNAVEASARVQHGRVDPMVISDLWVEAAQASSRAGDSDKSLARARRAAEEAPTKSSAQLFARGLEYRLRGAGTAEDSAKTLDDLARIEGTLDAEDVALRTFLVAEALSVLGRNEESMARLNEAYAQVGARPLVALGMAERLAAGASFAVALPLFETALGGNLLGFRSRGTVALAAADAAMRCDRAQVALKFLDMAAFDDDVRIVALKRIAQVAAALGDVARSRAVLLELAHSVGDEDRALTLAQLGRLLCASPDEVDQTEGARAFRDAIAAAPEGSILLAQLEAELRTLRARSTTRMSERPAADPLRSDDAPPPQVHYVLSGDASRVVDLETAVRLAPSVDERVAARRALARAHEERGAVDAAEAVLWEALGDGSVEAGDDLALIFGRSSARATDLLRVRRIQVELAPGDRSRLESLRAVALSDHNVAQARAVEHVARAFDPGAGPLPPPPVANQTEQPGMLQLITRPGTSVAHAALDALAIVWEGASTLFVRDAASYAITGVELVAPGGASAVSRLYEIVLTLLEAPQIPLYVRRAKPAAAIPDDMSVRSTVAILQRPAAVLDGETRTETGELRYALGHALASALPHNVLALGLGDREGQILWRAIVGAFGPPDSAREVDSTSGKIAEALWQTLPQKSQRRLQDLLRGAPIPEFEAVVEAARQNARRLGMFVAGDFELAVRMFLNESGQDIPAGPLALVALSSRFPAVADLLRLAVSPEYADARWRPASSPNPNGPSTGRFRFSRP